MRSTSPIEEAKAIPHSERSKGVPNNTISLEDSTNLPQKENFKNSDSFQGNNNANVNDSSKSKDVIIKMIKGKECNFESSKLSKREWNELMESFNFKEKII